MTDFADKSDKDIDQWISNHEKHAKIDVTLYFELLEELARRAQAKGGLYLEKSLSALKQAAIAGICISYGDLANASGVEWSKARQQMNGKNGHLDRLLELCHARRSPLLTAICVNQKNVEQGELEAAALSGFAEGARRIGRKVTDERAFHHACRAECWAWGQAQ
ncbi:hypothetical protein [Rhizobium sp. BR 315]|uniref:hypothetical protein n=1 Tax=Rhizobium sp. BR 315 TaxID=3040014 RepID=UPI003D3536F3